MKIVNYRIQAANPKVLAVFDLEEVPMSWKGKIYQNGAYRNWELRRNQNNKGLYVSSHWAYVEQAADPSSKPVHHTYVELPPEIKREFMAEVQEMLKPYCEELKGGPSDSSFVPF